MPSAAPLAPGLPIIGSVIPMMRDPLPFLVENYSRLGPVFRIRVANRVLTAIGGPEANVFFMKRPGAEYLESRQVFKRIVEEMKSPNLIVSLDGQRHQYLRQLLRPAYSREMLDRSLPQMCNLVEEYVRSLPVGKTLPVRPIMQKLIAELLSRAIVGRSSAAEFEHLLSFLSTLIYLSMGNLPSIRTRRPRYRTAKAALLKLSKDILQERVGVVTGGGGESTIADIALSARLDGQPLSEGDLAMIVLGPYIAGLDTAANTATFLIYELLRHPALMEEVMSEIDAAFSRGVPSAQELRGMRAFRGAFLETLRLHPVAFSILRRAAKSFDFGGYRIEAGDEVLLASGISHYLPQLYPDPQRFDIERYYEPRHEDRQAGAFYPFGVGPHLCLGSGQGEIVTMLSAAALLRYTHLSMDPHYKLQTRLDPLPLPQGFRIRIIESRSAATRIAPPSMQPLAMALPMLDRRVLADVSAHVAVKRYPPGTTIIRQGDIADRFFIIVTGEVEVEVTAGPHALPKVVNRLGPAAYFGEIGLLTGATRNATVRTTRETQLLELGRDGFMTMITEGDLTCQELSRVMRQRVIATGLAKALPVLDPSQAALVAAKVQHRRCTKGSDIVRQGDPADTFYVIVRGTCEVICRTPTGGQTVVAQLVQGDFFGEIGLLLGVPRTATVRASFQDDVELLALDAEGFRSLIREAKLAHEEIALVMRSRLSKAASQHA
jgi:cytochrome P450/CRP-like cAMP-binding protein